MHKSSVLLFLFAFLLGCLVSGSIIGFVTTIAMTKVQQGDMIAGFFTHPNTSYSRAVQNYEEAQRLWPFLRYNTTFTSQLNNEKTFFADLLTRPAVSIFFKNPVDNANITNLTETIKAIPGVTKVKYISKEDALAIYKQQNKGDKLLLQLVTSDFLPASIDVYVSNQSIKTQIETLATSKPFVFSVIKSPDY